MSDYVKALRQSNIKIIMAVGRKVEENGYTERVMRAVKEEKIDLNEYPDLLSAQLNLRQFIDDVYHTKRIHSSLGYLTPAEFAAQWQKSL